MKQVVLRLSLVAFGLVLGLIGAELVLRMMHRPQAGLEFDSLDDLRRTILSGESGTNAQPTEERVRRANLRSIINPHPDDQIIYDLKPNLDLVFQSVQVTTNSCGMRGPERSIPKPPNTIRIALLGDSFAFGWGVAQDKIFAQRLEDNLNRMSGGDPAFEVLNFAVPGYSTFQEVAKFEETGLDFNPDIVLVFFVQNDFGLPFYVRDIARPSGMLAATEFARLSWRAIDPEIKAQRKQLERLNPNAALRRLAEISETRGIKVYLTFNPRKDWIKYKNQLHVLKRRSDIRVISFRREFMHAVKRRQIPSEAVVLPNDPHTSALRHALYGDMLTSYFMEYLQ